MTLRDAVVAIIAQLDRSRVESEVTQLTKLQNQLAASASAAREAAGAVGLMDKFNIFSKSQEEQERDQKKKNEAEFRDAVASKQAELQSMIEKVIPPAILIQCTLGDLESELSRAMKSIRDAQAEYEEFSEAVSDQFGRIRRYLNSQNSAGGAHAKTISDLKFNAPQMEQHITASAEACEAAHAQLKNLIEQVGAPLSRERLMQETLATLVEKRTI